MRFSCKISKWRFFADRWNQLACRQEVCRAILRPFLAGRNCIWEAPISLRKGEVLFLRLSVYVATSSGYLSDTPLAWYRSELKLHFLSHRARLCLVYFLWMCVRFVLLLQPRARHGLTWGQIRVELGPRVEVRLGSQGGQVKYVYNFAASVTVNFSLIHSAERFLYNWQTSPVLVENSSQTVLEHLIKTC